MTVSKKDLAAAATATPAIKSPTASDSTARPDKRLGAELADQDLDNVSGGPTSVERNPKPI